MIPRAVDEYLTFIDKYPDQPRKERLNNPAWHIHNGAPPQAETLHHPGEGDAHGTTITFGMLLNLAAVANSEDPAVLWGFLRDGHARLVFAILPGVTVIRQHCRDARRACAPQSVNHDEQLHQIMVRGWTGRIG